MSENNQESLMETSYEKVKLFPLFAFFGLKYFFNSKKKKGSWKHGNVRKMFACAYRYDMQR